MITKHIPTLPDFELAALAGSDDFAVVREAREEMERRRRSGGGPALFTKAQERPAYEDEVGQ